MSSKCKVQVVYFLIAMKGPGPSPETHLTMDACPATIPDTDSVSFLIHIIGVPYGTYLYAYCIRVVSFLSRRTQNYCAYNAYVCSVIYFRMHSCCLYFLYLQNNPGK